MSERRFTEDEVAEILKQAVELQDSGTSMSASRGGLTLSELQEIGREVGVSPEIIQQAARRLEPSPVATRSFLGLPLGVGRTVELNRTLTDDEWDRLVVDLRQTFNARGVIRHEGSLRTWSNGNLQVLLEPTASGQRLRLRTVNGGSQSIMMASMAMFASSVFMTVAGAFGATIGNAGIFVPASIVGSIAAGMFALGAIRLPGWARTRQQQMDEIADRLTEPAPLLR
jgi:hypothetical protein